jgi:hypothetical protein
VRSISESFIRGASYREEHDLASHLKLQPDDRNSATERGEVLFNGVEGLEEALKILEVRGLSRLNPTRGTVTFGEVPQSLLDQSGQVYPEIKPVGIG